MKALVAQGGGPTAVINQSLAGVVMTVHILAAVAQHEREIISAPDIRGLAAAKASWKPEALRSPPPFGGS